MVTIKASFRELGVHLKLASFYCCLINGVGLGEGLMELESNVFFGIMELRPSGSKVCHDPHTPQTLNLKP